MIIYQMKKPIECYDTDCVGVTGDNIAYTQYFYIKDVSDDSISYTLHLRFADGSVNSITPDIVIPDGEGTEIRWIVKKNDIFTHGYFELQIEGRNKFGLVFQTEIVRLYADESMPIEDKEYENPNSETLRLREEAYAALQEMKSQQAQIEENVKKIEQTDLDNKADKATTYTKDEVDAALSQKLDDAVASVETHNIAEKAVTPAKIAGFAVTSDKIAYGAVGYPQLADNSVNYEKLSDYAVHYENLQKGCINLDNFSDMLLDSYNQREVTWNRVSDKSKITDSELNYPSIKYLNEYYYDADEANNLLAQKYDSSNIETGSGSLTPYSSSVDIVKSADFTYQRVGRVVTVNINVVFNAGTNITVRFINLPFRCKNTVNPRELCVTSEKAVHVWAINKDSAWLNIFSDSGVSFADGETLAFTISYLVS